MPYRGDILTDEEAALIQAAYRRHLGRPLEDWEARAVLYAAEVSRTRMALLDLLRRYPASTVRPAGGRVRWVAPPMAAVGEAR